VVCKPHSWVANTQLNCRNSPCKAQETVHSVAQVRISFVLTLFILEIDVGPDPYRKGSIVNVTTYVATIN